MIPQRSASGLSSAARFSYWFMLLLLIALIALHLATPLLAALFSYLGLTKLLFTRRGGKWVAIALFIVGIAAAGYALGYFGNQSVKALPEIADRSIPSVITWAKQQGIELPFTDYDSLKDLAFDTAKSQAQYLGSFAKFARGATTNALLMLAGCVVAISLFLNPQFELGSSPHSSRGNLYSETCSEIGLRFRTLYQSFVTVMGAQIVISAINSFLTAVFILILGFPYAIFIVGATFICGLLPVVGNIISNTIVVMVGFTISPKMALIALIFLVVVHKLEYFLNSKIVGWRIRNPLWLTLLGLIIGEKLMGVPGMILAPVILNYIKLEASTFRPTPKSEENLVVSGQE
jgi:predicted PurR-regulated permease PerM